MSDLIKKKLELFTLKCSYSQQESEGKFLTEK